MGRIDRETKLKIKIVGEDNSTDTKVCKVQDLEAIDTLQDAVNFTLKGSKGDPKGDKATGDYNAVKTVKIVSEETLYKVGDYHD